jgi:hypothetical protein
VNDRDLAVYVKAEKAPDDTPSLVQWLRDEIAKAYSTLSADQIVANTNCVTVTFAGSGLSVDVVPVLYEGGSPRHLVRTDPASPRKANWRPAPRRWSALAVSASQTFRAPYTP